jgi:CheY-like chemotaxis protein
MKIVLVVDDEEHQRLLYKEELGEEGYRVVLAKNGKEAIEKLKAESPDIVVLDIRMPVMDGLEALGVMIRDEKKVPVIIHSAYSSYKDDFMSWAADDYVIKSSDLSGLKQKIKDKLEQSERE